MENLINEEIIRVKELMGILNEDITVNIPQVIKSKLKDVERKYNVTITDANVNAELKEEGQYYDDNGGEDAKARKQIDKLVSALRQTFPNIKKGVVSSYRSYDQQVDTFGGKIARDGGVSKRQRYSALPGFSQHHTGKTFDILSVEPSWWNQNSDVKKWVADNCGKFGFKVSYPSDGVLRKAEPWHLYYVGGESSESSTTTPTIPNSKVDDYYSSDKVDPKLEKETVKQFKKVGCTASRDYSESPTFDDILKDESKVIRIGHKGNPVTEIQKILDGLGYDLGKCGIDGLFGPKTKKALEQFQSDRGLNVSSSVNKVTLDKLKNPGDKVKTTTTTTTPKGTNNSQVSADVTNDNEYSIIKSDYKGKNVHVLFGGSHTSTYSKNGADPSSIQKYVKFLKPYSNNAIIVITHHMNTLDNVRKYVKEKLDGAVVTSIAGFSQGGKETWRHADDSSLKLVGLIDPSTYSIDLTLGPNTYLVCDPNNWGTDDFVGQVRKKLQWYCAHKDDPKYAGHVECTKGIRHMNFDILEYFYQKYGSRI